MKTRKGKAEFQTNDDAERTTAPGVLYVVATPIGNLEDMTFRAVRILREVDLVAAEDTRHSRKLLSHFNIPTPLTSCFEHNEKTKSRFLLEKIQGGASIALITDAGTPCISDPGYHLVAEAVSEGITVVPVPGACAAMTALSAGGLPTDAFVFAGFLPPRQAKRRARLVELGAQGQVVVLYEAPQRVAATLIDIKEILGERRVVVARELTKLHEEFVRGSVSEVLEKIEQSSLRGEVVVLVGPAQTASAPKEVSVEDLLLRELNENKVSVKEAVARVAAETGIPRRQVYALALELSR